MASQTPQAPTTETPMVPPTVDTSVEEPTMSAPARASALPSVAGTMAKAKVSGPSVMTRAQKAAAARINRSPIGTRSGAKLPALTKHALPQNTGVNTRDGRHPEGRDKGPLRAGSSVEGHHKRPSAQSGHGTPRPGKGKAAQRPGTLSPASSSSQSSRRQEEEAHRDVHSGRQKGRDDNTKEKVFSSQAGQRKGQDAVLQQMYDNRLQLRVESYMDNISNNVGINPVLPGAFTASNTPAVVPSAPTTPANKNAPSDIGKLIQHLEGIITHQHNTTLQEIAKVQTSQREDREKLTELTESLEYISEDMTDVINKVSSISKNLATLQGTLVAESNTLNRTVQLCIDPMDENITQCVNTTEASAKDIAAIMEAINELAVPTVDLLPTNRAISDLTEKIAQIQVNLAQDKQGSSRVESNPKRESYSAGSLHQDQEDQQNSQSNRGRNSLHPREIPPHLRGTTQEYHDVHKREDTPVQRGVTMDTTASGVPFVGSRNTDYPKIAVYPTFSGSKEEDWAEFLEELDILQASYDLPDSEIVSKLPNILTGLAFVWFRVAFKQQKHKSWEIWRTLIAEKFGNSEWRQKQLELLESDKFTYGRTDVLECLIKMNRRIESVYPALSFSDQKIHVLMRLPGELQSIIKPNAAAATDMAEFISVCEEVILRTEAHRNASKKSYTSNFQRRNWQEPQVPTNTGKKPFQQKGRASTVPLHSSTQDSKPRPRDCWKCGKSWTKEHTCKGVTKVNALEDDSSQADSDADLAYNSQQEDDDKNSVNILESVDTEVLNMSLFKEDNQGNLLNVQDAEFMQETNTSGRTKHCPTQCTALVNMQEATVVLDSGAGGSVVSATYLESLDKDWQAKLSKQHAGKWAGYGSTLNPVGTYTASVIFGHERGNIRCSMKFVVMNNEKLPRYFIIGNNIMALYGIKLNIMGSYFTIGRNDKRHFRLACTKEAPTTGISTVAEDLDTVSTKAQPEVLTGLPTPEPKEFEEAFETALWDPEISQADKEAVSKLCHEFPMVFAHGNRQLGKVTIDEFDIQLTVDDSQHPPCLQKKAYPASPKRRKDIEESIKDLLSLGVLEEVEGTPHGAVVSPVIIQYQGEKARMCGDFRALNDYTVSDIYAIPRIDSVIHNIQGARRISVLDAVKGYHQLTNSKRACNYLHIITHMGVFKYLRMPFGPKNGPSAFQRLMDRTFSKEIREGWITPYLDDLIIHSGSNEEHLEHLRKVFVRVEQINLTLSLKKCHFAFTSVKVLGHIVSGLLMSVDDNKVKAISSIPPPTTVVEVQRFLGMCGYYRQYIRDFQVIALPLSKLSCTTEVFEWTEERQQAFNILKEKLTEAPSLMLPDFNRPFILYTDASFVGLGAALHQKHTVNEKEIELPCCFISRALRNAELRYGATQLECLAVVWALEKLHYYLDGSTFELITDCQAVKSLLGLKTPNRHMFRWQLAIQEYRGRMTITHRPGALHMNADLLSRHPLPNDVDNPAGVEEVDIIEILGLHVVDLASEFFEEIRKGYETHKDLSTLVKILADPKNIRTKELVPLLSDKYKPLHEKGHFIYEDDLLYYRQNGCHRMVVNPDLKEQMLKLSHDDILAGHFSYEKSLRRLQNTAWWLGYRKDMEEYVSTCDSCQKANKKTGKKMGFLQEIQKPSKPWEIVNMDFVTGLPAAGDLSYNSALVVVCRLTRKTKFVPVHKDIDAKGVALAWWKHMLNEAGLPLQIISDRDPKFTAEFWQSLMKIMGCSLKLSTAHHPQTDGLAERMIQTLEDLIRRYCAFGSLYTDSEGFTHDWVSLLPGLEFAYNSTAHSTTEKTPFELERGYTPNSPRLLLSTKLGKLDVHPSASSFSDMQAKARDHANECISTAFAYEKKRWDKTHTEPNLSVGDQVLVSTLHFNNLSSSPKLKDPFIGPFTITELIGKNAIRVELYSPFARRHNVFPVSLVKLYRASDKNLFPKRASVTKELPEPEEEEATIHQVLNKRLVGSGKKKELQYLVTFKNKPSDYDRWVPANQIPEAGRLLRQLRQDDREARRK